MPTLREFIATRRNEIREEIARLKTEERELIAAQSVIDGHSQEPSTTRTPSTNRNPTIKQMIVDALARRAPTGGSADEIIDWVKLDFGADVPRSSMSPQLSRLKVEGKVAIEPETKNWVLAGAPQMNTAVDAKSQASEASTAEDQPEAQGREAGPGGGT